MTDYPDLAASAMLVAAMVALAFTLLAWFCDTFLREEEQ